MRRIIHNTTAIAACLSMLAPHVATARMAAAESGIVATGQSIAPAAPATDEVILLAQTDAQIAEQELQRRLLEAQQAKKKAERAEKRKAERREQKQEEARKERAEQKPRKAEQQQKQSEQKADKEQRKQKQEAAKRDDAQTRDARKAEQRRDQQQQDKQKRAEQRSDEQLKAEREAQRKAERQAERREEQRREKRIEEKLRADAEARRQREEDLTRRQRQAQREAERASRPAPVNLATSGTAQSRAGSMIGLGRLLDREVAGGLTEDRLACQSGGVYPCANGTRYVTPRGVVLERNSNGNYMLAPAESQIYRVTSDGEVVSRDAGRRQQSDAARQAARETRAAYAAALDDRRQRRDIWEQRVTEANRRSSAQDFQGSLRDALARADRQQRREEARSDDDDNSNLLKALLLGAGALAVGAMLNNNRQVALSTPDRVVVTRPDGSQEVIKDEVALLRQPGSTVTTENFDDGSSRTIVTRPDGSKVVTIRDADLRVLRRTLVTTDGRSTLLIDDTATVAPVDVSRLPAPAPESYYGSVTDEEALRAALQRESNIDRRFTLGQIRNIPEVRALVAPVDIDAITFDSGSAAITPDQAQQLSGLGAVIGDAVAENPREMFLIEGHTDSVGSEATNLALSDRRAESVALALTEYFDVPPENLVVQGYGEEFPKIRAEGDIRDNRRASVRRITDLLQTAEAQ